MTTHENIYLNLKTTHELLLRDETPRSIQQLQRSHQLISLRRGIYFPSTVWRELRPWEQQVARVLAVSKAQPQAVISHTSAALLFNFAVPTESLVHIYSAPSSRGRLAGTQKHLLMSEQTPVVRFKYGAKATAPLVTAVDSIRMLPFRAAVVLADSALRNGVAFPDLSVPLLSATGRNCRTMKLVA